MRPESKEKSMFTLEKIQSMIPQPVITMPKLEWIGGKIHQIPLQDKEQYYVVVLTDGKTTH